MSTAHATVPDLRLTAAIVETCCSAIVDLPAHDLQDRFCVYALVTVGEGLRPSGAAVGCLAR